MPLSVCKAEQSSSVNIRPPHPLGYALYPPTPYKSTYPEHTGKQDSSHKLMLTHEGMRTHKVKMDSFATQ